ncbi:hypothetical protein MTO96_017818 [Rhipicephalus appendiculatus]
MYPGVAEVGLRKCRPFYIGTLPGVPGWREAYAEAFLQIRRRRTRLNRFPKEGFQESELRLEDANRVGAIVGEAFSRQNVVGVEECQIHIDTNRAKKLHLGGFLRVCQGSNLERDVRPVQRSEPRHAADKICQLWHTTAVEVLADGTICNPVQDNAGELIEAGSVEKNPALVVVE